MLQENESRATKFDLSYSRNYSEYSNKTPIYVNNKYSKIYLVFKKQSSNYITCLCARDK